jgi:hypothetical protein
VQLLLEKGADLAVADKYGWTPLCLASIYGHVNVVKLLLEKGANMAVADKDGWMPLCLASKNGHADIVKLLLEKGADIAVASNDGRTPLCLASNSGHADIVKLLLEKYKEKGIIKFCDVCDLGISNEDTYYHCQVCNNGDFDICEECFAIEARCLNQCHILKKERNRESA